MGRIIRRIEDRAGGGWLPSAIALLLFAVLAGWYLSPLLFTRQALLPDLEDTLHNIWTYAGAIQRIASGPLGAFFDARIFFPESQSAAFSELQPLNTAVFGLLRALSGDSARAYNLLLYFSFILTGYAAFLLARTLGAGIAVAIFTGVASAFLPYRFSHLAHAQALGLQWMLLPLQLCIAYLLGGGRWRLVVFGVLFLLQICAVSYVSLYLGMALCAVMATTAMGRGADKLPEVRSRLRRVVVVSGACIAASTPLYLPYLELANRGMRRGFEELSSYGLDLAFLAAAPPSNLAYGPITRSLRNWRPDGDLSALFPGFATLFAILAGGLLVLVTFRTTSGSAEPNQRMKRAISLGLLCAGLLLFVLALGPMISLLGQPIAMSPAVVAFQNFPVLGAFRYLPNHAHGALPLVLVGIGAVLSASVRSRETLALAATLCAVVAVFEFRPSISVKMLENGIDRPSPVYLWLKDQPSGAVMELPMPGELNGKDPGFIQQFTFMTNSLVHGKPIANGVSGFFPSMFRESITLARRFPSLGAAERWASSGIRYVVVHKTFSADLAARARRAARLPEWTVAYSDPEADVFIIGRIDPGKASELIPDVAQGMSAEAMSEPRCPREVAAGAGVVIEVDARNLSGNPWRSQTGRLTSPEGKGEVRLGIREWRRLSDNHVPRDTAGNPVNGRGYLDSDLPGGESGRLVLGAAAPGEPGRYVVRLNLVQELIRWSTSADKMCEIEVH